MPRLDAIGIVVRSLPDSMQFYRLLGVEFGEADSADHVEAALPNGMRLMLDSESLMRELDKDWNRPAGQSMGLAFHCGSPAEVDEAVRGLAKKGYQIATEPWDAFWGQRYAQVFDPDGHKVDLFAPLA
jgi:uncharacterized glyoxalase superfamily protein PhnB